VFRSCGFESPQLTRRASEKPRQLRVLARSASEFRIAITDELVQYGVLGVEIEKGFGVESSDGQLDANAARVYEVAQRVGRVALPSLGITLSRLLDNPAQQAVQCRNACGHPVLLVRRQGRGRSAT